MASRRIAVIMAGGGGSRLWPASSPQRPKQLLDPLMQGSSLLAQTAARLDDVAERVVVVTAAEQVQGVRRELPGAQVIAEPSGRNTAPCVALTAVHLRAELGGAGDDATLIVLPADHHVADAAGMRRALQAACAHAEATGVIVTLGIEPDHAATGYGYIEREAAAADAIPGDGDLPVYRALRFIEKPDAERAAEFVASGRHLWNAGIFVMSLSRIEAEFARLCPDTWAALRPVAAALAAGDPASATTACLAAYRNIAAAPIDTAIMEQQTDLRVVPARIGWTDLGSWRAVHSIAPHDPHQNATVGPLPPTLLDAHGNLVWSEGPEVALIGVQNLAVVVADGKILVCRLDRAQDVRTLGQKRD